MESAPINVLLVEDNLTYAHLLYESLQEVLPEQFQITHTRRLSEALEYLWEEPCNVVLLDLGLPDSYGLDTLVVMRAQAPSVPIVVLTGFQDEALAVEALQGGAQDYLVKGQMDSRQLARAMRYAIARQLAEEALVRQGVAFAKAEALQSSRQRLIAVLERVRREIAVQLHDGIQEKLLILQGRLQEILEGISATSETSQRLSEVIVDLNQVIERQVGVLSSQLYPATLSAGIVPTLRSLGDQFAGVLAIELELDVELLRQEQAGHDTMPGQVRLAAYRIVEEALTNVVNHAKASKATVRLDLNRDGWLRLMVQDDGQSFDMENAPRGLGLATMQDYAEAVGGECVVRSIPGIGTVVAATLPLGRPGAADLAGQGVTD